MVWVHGVHACATRSVPRAHAARPGSTGRAAAVRRDQPRTPDRRRTEPFRPPGNRFYPALFRAGIIDRLIDASGGYAEEDRSHLLARGIGITNLVARATARADELTAAELVAGADDLRRRVGALAPKVVAILGVTAYRTAFGRPRTAVGRQPEDLGGSQLWVVPNPSGLNAHATVASLAMAYRDVAVAAGLRIETAQ